MKRAIVFLSSILITTVTLAESSNCRDLLIHPNWPNDKLEKGLECTLSKTLLGDSETSYPRLCFGIVKTEFSNFKTAFYSTYRFDPRDSGGILSSVTLSQDGSTGEGSIVQTNSTLEVNANKSSFEFNQKWIESTVVNLDNPSTLRFNIYDKGFFSRTLKHSASYDCRPID